MTRIDVATTDDIDDFVRSVAGLFIEDGGRYDSTMDTTWPARDGAAYYRELVGDSTCLLALARDGDRTLGHLVGRLRAPDGLRTVTIAVLESIRVDPTVRGRGVGTALVSHFADWARANDARQASVTAFAENEGAQRFYRRHGFAPMSVTSRLTL
jgi:ribosomal protein S18 acetylase RimI-like enzyme